MTFIAKYRGRCAECGQGIEPGDECAYTSQPGAWSSVIHATCPPSLDDVDAKRKVCERCWLVIPCGCDE